MNMISTGAFQSEMDASNRQETLAEKFARVWEKKNTKVARAGGVSLMALSLAACGSDDAVVETPAVETPATETPVVETPVVETPTTPVVTALVAGSDTTGTAGADSFSGTVGSLTSTTTFLGTDDIAGGEGADTISLALGANFGGFTVTGTNTGSMTGIETVELSASDTIARTFSATGVSGVETYKIDGSNAVVSITNSADLSAIELSSIASGAFSITYAAPTGGTSPTAGTADTLNMSVAGLGSATADVSITAAGVETLALTSNAAPTAAGTTNYLNLANVTNATSTTVTGAANTDVAAVSSATTSFDASGNTGDVTAALGNAAAASLATVKTGSGADKVTAAYDDLTANATIDLGTGADSLTLTGAATSVSQFVMSGVETLDITSVTGGTTTVSMVKSDGAASTIIAGLSKTGADAAYAGKLAFVGDSGAKNIDVIGASNNTSLITTDTTGAVDIDVSAASAATTLAPNAAAGEVTANAASSIDVSTSGFVNLTGTISATKATSAALTVAGQAQTGIDIRGGKAETLSISAAKDTTLANNSDFSGAKVVTIDTSGAFSDTSTNGLAAAQNMTLSGAGSKAAMTFTNLVGATDLAYSQTINASGLKAGLTFTGDVDAGSGSLTVDASGVTGAVDMSKMDAAGTVTYTASSLGANTLDQISGKTVVVNATDALGGVTFSGGATDISLGSSATINGPTVSATDVDIVATAAATAITVTATGGIVADTYDVKSGAATASVTVSGDGGLGTDVYGVELVNFTTNTTSTVTVNLAGIVADTTTQSAVTIDIDAEVTNKVSVTGSKGNNDTVNIDGAKNYDTNGLVLSGVEKITIDDTVTISASSISGQAIDVGGDGAGNADIVKAMGTAGADAVDFSTITHGTGNDATYQYDLGAGADTITVTGTVVNTIIIDTGDSATFAATTNASISTVGMDVITGLDTSDKIKLADYTAASTDTLAATKLDSDAEANGNDLNVTVADNAAAGVRGDYSSTANTFTESAAGADLLVAYDTNNAAANAKTIEAVVLVGLGANTIAYAAAGAAGEISIA